MASIAGAPASNPLICDSIDNRPQGHQADVALAVAPQRDACLHPMDGLLHDFPAVTLDGATVVSLLQGQVVKAGFSMSDLPEGAKIRLYDQGKHFLGLGEVTAQGEIAPRRLLGYTE